MKKINKVNIFYNDNFLSHEILKKLVQYLNKYGFVIDNNDYELAIAIGGDGSFLRMLKNCNFKDIYYVGINTGTLGFLQEINCNLIEKFVKSLSNEDYKINYLGVQKTILKTKTTSSMFYSLNEIVIREKSLNTAFLKIYVGDNLLENFTGDGILISTSVGSTAYNLSFKGAIVYDELHTLQITPIAPLNTKVYRSLLNSIIIPSNKKITICPELNRNNLLVTVDGENNVYDDVVNITTMISKRKIKLLRLKETVFTNKINEKFLK